MKAIKGIDLDNSTVAILGALAVGGFLLWKVGGKAGEAITGAVDLVGGVLTGNNKITENATNGAGEKTTAYQGWGIVGTLGAATNAVSGGTLASAGEWLGGKVYDWTH